MPLSDISPLYREIEKHVETLEKLQGPVYDIKRDHCFKEIFKNIDQVKKLQGPIYDLNLPAHHFSQIEQHLDSMKNLQGPVYDVDSKNTLSQIIKHVEELKALQGPIYGIGKPGNVNLIQFNNFPRSCPELFSHLLPKNCTKIF